ncbi:MAG TPA: amino acid ABC transporter permease [Alphaproteobacteria bacterium]|nr:amino acid ABC transporter permease [Alphaproteobacteria bacterium]
MYQWHFDVVTDNWEVFLDGAAVTAQLTVFAFSIAVVLGLLIALARLSRFGALRAPATFYVEIFRSTPALVQLVWIYYALPIITGIRLDNFAAIGLGLGLHEAAYFSEIFRGGILSIDRGQVDSAKSVGMVYYQVMWRIILPQAVRRMIPPFMNETANLIKLTTLGSILAVYELLHAADVLITSTYRPLEVYTATAVVFALIIYPLIYVSRLLERYWGGRVQS